MPAPIRDHTRLIAAVAVVLILAGVLMSVGCSRNPYVAPSLPDSAAVISGQKGKDAAIILEAAKIDAIAPAAKPHTDAQRAAIAAAPAAVVERELAAWNATAEALQKEVARLQKELDEANDKTDRVIRLGGYALAAILVALGVASFFLASQVPWLGPRIGFALGASGASVFAMVQAYEWTKQHPWITGFALLGLVVAGALAYANHFHSKESAK